jgi:hypothetical protein
MAKSPRWPSRPGNKYIWNSKTDNMWRKPVFILLRIKEMVKLRTEYIWVADVLAHVADVADALADVADVLASATSVQYFWSSKTDKMQRKPVFIDFKNNKNV